MITINLLIDLLELGDKKDYKKVRERIIEEIGKEIEELEEKIRSLKNKKSVEEKKRLEELEEQYNKTTLLIDYYFINLEKELDNESRIIKVANHISKEIEEYEMSLK